MEAIIAARHFNLRPDTRDFIEERIASLKNDYQKITSIRVVLDHQKPWFYAEVILHGKHIEIESKAKSDNLIPAIDEAIEKTERQLRRHLDKQHEHKAPSVADMELHLETAEAAEAVDE